MFCKFGQALLVAHILGTCWALPGEFEAVEDDTSADETHERVARNAVHNPAMLWPGNLICYRFHHVFSPAHVALVRDAMNYIESLTFITFQLDTVGRTDCVSINPVPAGSGCQSLVGYLGRPQTMKLPNIPVGTGCLTKYQIVHELLHTCGMYHQHNAPKRDEFVDIIWSNIKPGSEHAFIKNTPQEATSFGFPYDYDSIMHYGPTTASANGMPTIVPKSNVEIGQRTHLSGIDVMKLRQMYPQANARRHKKRRRG